MAFRYSYSHVSDVLARPFILAGAAVGSLYPMYASTRRDTFGECVSAAAISGSIGAIGGLGAAHLHPVVLGAVVVGGPTWVYQRLRFPSEEALEAERVAKVPEVQMELAALDAAKLDSLVQPTVELR